MIYVTFFAWGSVVFPAFELYADPHFGLAEHKGSLSEKGLLPFDGWIVRKCIRFAGDAKEIAVEFAVAV